MSVTKQRWLWGVVIIGCVFFTFALLTSTGQPCHYRWQPKDGIWGSSEALRDTDGYIYFCGHSMNTFHRIVIVIGSVWILSLNTYFGYIFVDYLRHVSGGVGVDLVVSERSKKEASLSHQLQQMQTQAKQKKFRAMKESGLSHLGEEQPTTSTTTEEFGNIPLSQVPTTSTSAVGAIHNTPDMRQLRIQSLSSDATLNSSSVAVGTADDHDNDHDKLSVENKGREEDYCVTLDDAYEEMETSVAGTAIEIPEKRITTTGLDGSIIILSDIDNTPNPSPRENRTMFADLTVPSVQQQQPVRLSNSNISNVNVAQAGGSVGRPSSSIIVNLNGVKNSSGTVAQHHTSQHSSAVSATISPRLSRNISGTAIDNVNASHSSMPDTRLRYAMFNTAALTVFAVCSTFVGFLFWFVSWFSLNAFSYLVYLDAILNCVVVLLMFRFNEPIYNRLCFCCIHYYNQRFTENKPPNVSSPSSRAFASFKFDESTKNDPNTLR